MTELKFGLDNVTVEVCVSEECTKAEREKWKSFLEQLKPKYTTAEQKLIEQIQHDIDTVTYEALVVDTLPELFESKYAADGRRVLRKLQLEREKYKREEAIRNILSDYRKDGFDEDQLIEIETGYAHGLSPMGMELYTKLELSWRQMEQIRLGLEFEQAMELPPACIRSESFAKAEYSAEVMKEKREIMEAEIQSLCRAEMMKREGRKTRTKYTTRRMTTDDEVQSIAQELSKMFEINGDLV